MTETVLRTKIQIPRPRPLLVPRPDLVTRLNRGLAGRLTLVSAPAGYGKTTLVANWADALLQQDPAPAYQVCWLSLDRDDDDPARFLVYLMAALRQVLAGVDEADLRDLPSMQPAGLNTGLATLINALDQSAGPTVLIIDDYHLIAEPVIHRGVAFLVDHLPQTVHLVIISRADPPLALHRLRARGQLSEIRQRDLQFSDDEAVAFLLQSAGLPLSAEEAGVLNERVEGWAAGLQLAALAIQSRPDDQPDASLTHFIRSFAGSDRFILDYLVEEVLQYQPDDIQTFLLQTSVLDRLTAPLCAALLGEGDGPDRAQATLDQLDLANLFIIPLDNERCWFRYHRLFADLLSKRLRQQWPERLPELHRRASDWYATHDLPGPAVHHALAAGEIEQACQVIDHAAEEMMMAGQIVTLLRWLDALPQEAIEQRPTLAAIYAGTLLIRGRPLAEVDRWLQHAGPAGDESGEIATYRALLAIYRLDTAEAMRLAREAEHRLPQEKVFLRSLAAEAQAFVYTIEGDIDLAQQAFGRAVEIGRSTGSLLIAVGSLCNQAGLLVYQGQLHRARAIYEQALALSITPRGLQLPIAGKALIGLGEIYREWGELDEAERMIRQGVELYLDYAEAGIVFGYLSLARVKQSQNQLDAAHHQLEQARRSAVRFDVTEMDDFLVDCFQAQLWLARGDIAAAARWAVDRAAQRARLPAPLREMEEAVLIRLYLAQGEPGQALASLQPMVAQAGQRGFHGRLIKLLVLQSLACQVGGSLEAAVTPLSQALTLAAPEGFRRVFLDEGEPMARLLHLVAGRQIVPEFTADLLAAFGRERHEPAGSPPAAPAVPLIEPLSDRELEVLQLIAQGLSNSQIADRLVISLSTVKGHASTIYGKLNVHNRTQAVAQARALGLIAA